MLSKIYKISEGMSLNKRHIEFNAMNSMKAINDVNHYNIARETLTRGHIKRDGLINVYWNRGQSLSQDSSYIPDNPNIPTASMLLNVKEDGDYRIRWSCNFTFSDPYGIGSTFVDRVRCVPFAGNSLLWSGADVCEHFFPHTYVTSSYNRTRYLPTGYPHSMSGECNFHITNGGSNIGLLFGKLVNSTTWEGASGSISEVDLTIMRRVR